MAARPQSLSARDIAYTLHPYTNLRAHERQGPLVITKGNGVFVSDDEGNDYIEGMAGLWCTGLGFSERRLAEAAKAQMERLPYMHMFAHRSTEPAVRLAERLVELTPPSLTKAYFCNSGSEAIDHAIKLIWYYNNARGKPTKKIIFGRKRGYHGVTLAGGHLTALAYAQNGFDLPMADRFRQLTTPSFYRDGHPGESEDAFSSRLADELDTMIEAEGADNVAAFFAEPVMGAGGVVVPPRGYFEKIQAVLRKHDVLFVADEVICGFGRTGNMFGCDTYAIEPDLMTCAKQLSSAYLPIAAVMIGQRVYDVLADQSDALGVLGLGYTYAGHPVSAAVANRTLDIYEEDGIIAHVQAVAPHFQKRLKLLEHHPLVGEARGVGLIGGVEIVKDKVSREQFDPSRKVAATVAANCLPRGLILRGLPGDVIGICPPLIITEKEIDLLFDRLASGLDETLSDVQQAA
jgi:4-aminobutyrate--pyruvate transaminase